MRITVVIAPGQSNEQGVAGTEGGSSRTNYGRPILDASGNRSMWPRVSSRLGRAGILASFQNRARGSTGMASYWIGSCRDWVSGMFVNTGSYVLSGGNIWKCAAANTSNNDPYGLSTASPSASVGADNVQWQDLGAPTAEDVAGAIYTRGSARFDPNGALGAALTSANALAPVDRRFALISIGQSDKTAGMTVQQYRAAYEQAVRFWLDSGFEVLAGMTVIGRTSGMSEWMRDVGDPAWQSICQQFGGVRGFHAGVNLYRHFASDKANPFSTNINFAESPAIGLISDQLHMNSAAYDSAADAWSQRIGVICGYVT